MRFRFEQQSIEKSDLHISRTDVRESNLLIDVDFVDAGNVGTVEVEIDVARKLNDMIGSSHLSD